MRLINIKNKLHLFWVIFTFLLIFPFRLPLSVILIKGFDYIAKLVSPEVLPPNILDSNVLVTKILYNLVFGAIFLFNVEKLTINLKGRHANGDPSIWWTTAAIGIVTLIYAVYDGAITYKLAELIP